MKLIKVNYSFTHQDNTIEKDCKDKMFFFTYLENRKVKLKQIEVINS